VSEQPTRIRVWGRVQGVGFRASARAEARNIGMQVTAENQPDGTVLLEANGSAEQMEVFLEWVHRGPRHARVDRVEVTPVIVPADDV
jgi:acylphosphatase